MIEANIVEIQTKRKTERDELQLELSLAANRISRPIAVQDMSSQGDNPVIHNRSTDSKSADQLLSEVLGSVESALTSKLTGDQEIGRAHVCTPVTNAQLVCRLLL